MTPRSSQTSTKRAGTILPGVLAALMVGMALIALVLDRLWLDAATSELRTSSEAAALAAARELVTDDILCTNHNPADLINAARERAGDAAWQNRVAGQRVDLDTSPMGDIQFGQLVADPDTGRVRFLQTTVHPRTVRVVSRRNRNRGNPIALWFRDLTGFGQGNAQSLAEVTANNQILGVRPFDGVYVPALPLAILACDSTGRRTDTWEHQIQNQNGPDEYRINPETGAVEQGQDGIPEIHLHSMSQEENVWDANVQLVDLNTDLRTDPLLEQFQNGWSEDSLKEFGGELRLYPESQWMTSLAAFDRDHANGLESLIGTPRICLLYSGLDSSGNEGFGKMEAVNFVAGRIMSVECHEKNQHVFVFQPSVLTTRTAVLAEEKMDLNRLSADEHKSLENPYIYKLHLTR